MATNLEDGSLVLCGAHSKRNKGNPCQAPAMTNGRCRFHGGLCKGPKTREGRKKCGLSNLRHGHYSNESMIYKKRLRHRLKEARHILENVFR